MAKRICVIGTGYVGLVTGASLADFGNQVVCVDIDSSKIRMLNEGRLPIFEPGLAELVEKNSREGRLSFSTGIGTAVETCEGVFLGVGTPTTTNGGADLSFLKQALAEVATHLVGPKVIVTKSTVPVGTNRWIKKFLHSQDPSADIQVVSNPEFLREGKAVHDVFHPDRVVIGAETSKAQEFMKDIYKALYLIETPFLFCNFETAELIKYASNAFLATKITFINQMANLCESLGADVHQLAKGMGMDGRISSKFLHPGPGFGGSCFPKDTKALVQIGESCGEVPTLVREVILANQRQKERMVSKMEEFFQGTLVGKKVAILGLAFKAGTDDIRESPALGIIRGLLKRGANVMAHDPQAMENAKSEFGSAVAFAGNEYSALDGADALVILTEWNQYRSLDLEVAKKRMKGNFILDTRNVLDVEQARRLGFFYKGVGR